MLTLPMKVRTETRHHGAVAILRGSRVDSLKIGERFEGPRRHEPALPVIDWGVHHLELVPYGCTRLRIAEFPLLAE